VKVRFSAAAANDLEAISDAIARDNPSRAVTFVEEIEIRCRDLAATPKAYPLLPDHQRLEIRKRVFGRYLIFYRISDRSIDIVRVLHGAMDYDSILFPET
jgi:toxin ParE1/3/4